MVGITPDEGYRRSAGKEEAGIEVVKHFLWCVIGLGAEDIEDPLENYHHGDLRVGTTTIECKTQPINPEKYTTNFIEVFKDMGALSKEKHREGFETTARILGMTIEALTRALVVDCRERRRPKRPLGNMEYTNASLQSIGGSAMTIYANPDPVRTFLYLYSRQHIIGYIRREVQTQGLFRALGNSDDDTFGVLIPVSPARWRRTGNNWIYLGEGIEPIATVKSLLTTSS